MHRDVVQAVAESLSLMVFFPQESRQPAEGSLMAIAETAAPRETAVAKEGWVTRELRLAIICYGGVSLAIYMHGVT